MVVHARRESWEIGIGTYYHHNHNHSLEVLGNLPSILRRITVLRRNYMFLGGPSFGLCISKLFPSLGDAGSECVVLIAKPDILEIYHRQHEQQRGHGRQRPKAFR